MCFYLKRQPVIQSREKGFNTLMSLCIQTILSLSLENARNAVTEKKNYIVCKQHEKVAFVCLHVTL